MIQESHSPQDPDIRPEFVKIASSQFQKLWETLSERDKGLLESQASLRNLDTQEKADRFFESRDLSHLRISAVSSPSQLYKQEHLGIQKPKTRTSKLNESEDSITRAMKLLS